MAKRKMTTRTSTIEGMVGDALGEVQSLRDEMREWADNMSDNNMEHLPKYDEVSECADELDSYADNEPPFPDNAPEALTKEHTWEELPPKLRQSRANRLGDAMSSLNRAVDLIQEWLDGNGEHELHDEVEQYQSELQEIIDGCEFVSFPGMY